MTQDRSPNFPRRERPPLQRLYLWATCRLYNELAWSYDLAAWMVSGGRWDHWRRMALDYVDRQPVLEVGFGTGALLQEMARRGWRAVGIDASPAMQRVTARKMRRSGLWVPRAQVRAQALPFAGESFGAVVSTFPAQYIADPASLREFWRVLQPGGRLVIVGLAVYRRPSALDSLSSLVFGKGLSDPVAELQDRLRQTGFEVYVTIRDDPPWQIPVMAAEKPA